MQSIHEEKENAEEFKEKWLRRNQETNFNGLINEYLVLNIEIKLFGQETVEKYSGGS